MNDWPSIEEIENAPRDLLKAWYWTERRAMTPAHQQLVQRAAQILYPPPAVAPVYRFTEPVTAAPTPEAVPSVTAKPVRLPKAGPETPTKTKPKPEPEPEPQGSLFFLNALKS